MEKKSVTLAITAGFAIGAVFLGRYLWNKRKEAKAKKFDVVFVLGGPGAGKGTNCAKIVRDFGYVHLSAGDLLRAERDSGSDNAKLINDMIKNGQIVPPDITIKLLFQAMEKSGNTKFLVDGFPRDMHNLSRWNEMADSICNVQFLLVLNCPEDVMEARLLERGKSSGRSDDNIESIKKRFRVFNADTKPVIEFFQKNGKSREVDSSRDEESIYSDVKHIFQSASFRQSS